MMDMQGSCLGVVVLAPPFAPERDDKGDGYNGESDEDGAEDDAAV